MRNSSIAQLNEPKPLQEGMYVHSCTVQEREIKVEKLKWDVAKHFQIKQTLEKRKVQETTLIFRGSNLA